MVQSVDPNKVMKSFIMSVVELRTSNNYTSMYGDKSLFNHILTKLTF